MNKGMQFLFKSLGIDITPETVAMLAALIPQLPAKINEAAQAINAALANFDARLRALESGNKALIDILARQNEATQNRSLMLEERILDLQIRCQEVLSGHSSGVSDATRPATGTGRRGGRTSGAGILHPDSASGT